MNMLNYLGLKHDQFLLWVVGKPSYDKYMGEMPNRLAITLNILVGLIGLIYLTSHIIQDHTKIILPHILLILGSILGIVLGRFGKFDTGKIILILIFNLVIYLANSSHNHNTGGNLYFFTMIIGSYVVFDYRKMKYAYFFTVLSFGLYILSSLYDFSILPIYTYTESVVRFHFVFNTVTFTVVSSLILIVYIRMINSRNRMIIEQKNELERSNKELDQFLYSTSHDLRAPLASILGLLNVVEITDNTKEVEHYHGLMKTRIQKMEHFIRDVIDIIKNTRVPVKKEALFLKELVEKTYNEMNFQEETGNIEFINNIPETLKIDCDRIRVATLFNNLISNSLKYSDPSKDHSQVVVSGNENGKFVKLNISDNGIGINKNQLEKIFGMFYRATEASKGAGLGLYIASETVRKLNGTIDVESTPRIGTTFKITLPKN
ncbi:MAG: HAMP domain-containing histidine kinase [Saprospiraceae bacterium]|nr:HAMP domain-containing histidine kinase [Saprospiraceae bacterium]